MAYFQENNTSPEEKRRQAIAIASAAGVYILLFVFFIVGGLKFQVPPPPEYGIELDMSGGGGGGASAESPKPQEAAPTPKATSTPAATPKVSTQKVEQTAKVVPDQTNAKPTETKVQETPPQPQVNQAALFKKKTGGGTGSGTGVGSGTGSGNGPGSGSGSGGGIGSGSGQGEGDFWLDGRPVVKKAYPKARENTSGVIIVEFRADKEGNVIYAKAGARGTTINDAALWEECERAAKQSKFKAKADASAEERGTIRYRFVVR